MRSLQLLRACSWTVRGRTEHQQQQQLFSKVHFPAPALSSLHFSRTPLLAEEDEASVLLKQPILAGLMGAEAGTAVNASCSWSQIALIWAQAFEARTRIGALAFGFKGPLAVWQPAEKSKPPLGELMGSARAQSIIGSLALTAPGIGEKSRRHMLPRGAPLCGTSPHAIRQPWSRHDDRRHFSVLCQAGPSDVTVTSAADQQRVADAVVRACAEGEEPAPILEDIRPWGSAEWLALLQELEGRECLQAVLKVLDFMEGHAGGVVDIKHYLVAVAAAADLKDVAMTEKVIKRAESVLERLQKDGHELNFTAYNDLIMCYCKAGDVAAGESVLARMADAGVEPNLQTIEILVEGYLKANGPVKMNMMSAAERLIKRMRQEGVALSAYVYSKLLDAYLSFGAQISAEIVLEQMHNEGLPPDPAMWNDVIDLYNMSRNIEGVARVFSNMLVAQCPVDRETYLKVLRAFAGAGEVEYVKAVLQLMVRKGCEPDVGIYKALMDTYIWYDRLEDAEEMYDELRVTCKLDVEAFALAIKLFTAQSRWTDAGKVFEQARKHMQSEGTASALPFSAALSACAKAQQWQTAKQLVADLLASNCKLDIGAVIAVLEVLAACPEGPYRKATMACLKDTSDPFLAVVYKMLTQPAGDDTNPLKEADLGKLDLKEQQLFYGFLAEALWKWPLPARAAQVVRLGLQDGTFRSATFEDKYWSLSLDDMTPAFAVVLIHLWLLELEGRFQKGELPARELTIWTGLGHRGCKASEQRVVRSQAVSLFEFLQSPITLLSSRSDCMVGRDLLAVRKWLLDGAWKSRLDERGREVLASVEEK